MSKKLIEMNIVRKMILLIDHGLSERQIAHELKLSRPSVNRYKNRLLGTKKNTGDLLSLDDAELAAIAHPRTEQTLMEDAREAYIADRKSYYLSELHRTGVTRMLLWQEYLEDNPPGGGYGYAKFCELLAELALADKASYHMPGYNPGEMMMVDFAGDKPHYFDRSTGEMIECSVFVNVLPYSGYSYVICLRDEKTPSVIKALNASVAYFGGVTKCMKGDNMRTAVTKSSKYEPVFTEIFEQWALHNHVALFASRPRKPKDKAAVEKEVLLTYQRIYAPLRDKVFFSLDELNHSFWEQLELHHRKHFQKKNINRLEQFIELEKEHLQPLPLTPYEIRHKIECKAKSNYHVLLGEDSHQYSFPYKYIGQKLVVNYDTDMVEIFRDLQRIAIHKRSYKKDGYTTVKEHMPPNHQKVAEQNGWTPEYFLEGAARIGQFTRQYIEKVLQSREVIQQAFNACMGILRLANRYGADRLEGASKRGLAGSKFGYNILENILKNNLDKLSQSEPEDFHIPAHDNTRGADECL